jgi:hypothetical protein
MTDKIAEAKKRLPIGTALDIDDRRSTVRIDIVFNLVVRRNRVLMDVVNLINKVLQSDPDTLKLPLK